MAILGVLSLDSEVDLRSCVVEGARQATLVFWKVVEIIELFGNNDYPWKSTEFNN